MVATELTPELPPILLGRYTPAVEAKVRKFYFSVAEIFESWVTRRSSKHTQRAYQRDVLDFVEFREFTWPEESALMLTVPVADVLAFRDSMVQELKAQRRLTVESRR